MWLDNKITVEESVLSIAFESKRVQLLSKLVYFTENVVK